MSVKLERAVDSDSRFWPAWYNLGLTRAARGDDVGARFAFNRTLHYKPGHSQALFQEGLMAESRGDNDEEHDERMGEHVGTERTSVAEQPKPQSAGDHQPAVA